MYRVHRKILSLNCAPKLHYTKRFQTRKYNLLQNILNGVPHKMYGLVCENIAGYIKHKFGKDAWENIRRLASIDVPSFAIHQVRY